jgi:hypothetical protein
MKILVSLCTRGRYENYLPMALLSLAIQTRKPDHIRIYDDNDVPIDIRNIPAINYVLLLLQEKGISWDLEYGLKKGQHFNDERANIAGYDYVLRFDDDCVAESDYLENLTKEMKDDVGAVGGLVLQPIASKILPSNALNKIRDIYAPNIQWFNWEGESKEVEHLHSSFLYRTNIAHFDLSLSQVSFRGETMFTHELYMKGYKLIVTPTAKVWHFQSSVGGDRTESEEKKRAELYSHDEKIFNTWLSINRIEDDSKAIYLDNGLGDHIVFSTLLDDLKKKYGKLKIYCCYPGIFAGEDIRSVAEGMKIIPDVNKYNIYEWMWRNNWEDSLSEAFKKMYAL